jgi:glutathione synthase/RimK-type ligase-like ATP-grasp enzyme
VDALRERGVHVCVLDGDRFPIDARLNVELGGPATLELPDTRIDLRSVRAVWLTHIDVGAALGEDVHPDFHEAVAVQSELSLWDALAACERALFVDRPGVVARVPLGTAQLALARSVGLAVPKTITSNDPDRVRSFAAECGGAVVAKLLHSSVSMRQTANGRRGYPPRLLGEHELGDELERVRLCPQLFQEPIAKRSELRVTVVGSRVFAAAIDSHDRDDESLDWGDDPQRIASFHACELPDPVARSILALLDRLGLEFATIDLIVTPEHRHVFLELNPISYFGFVERAAKLPISDAIADLLAGNARPRQLRPEGP